MASSKTPRICHHAGQRHVYRGTTCLGTVTRTAAGDAEHRPGEPWRLRHTSGRIDRFASYSDLREEVRKL